MSLILVVDDLSSDRCIAGGLLSKDNSLIIDNANNGFEALKKIELRPPDLILTDLQMPEMNGLELVQHVRDHYQHIPTILMTARGSEDIAIKALQEGAASYIPKQYLAHDLLETVQRVLASAVEERSHSRLMQHIVATTYVLKNDLALISSLVRHLRQEAQNRLLCSEHEAMRLATALDEALQNAYYHGSLEVDSTLKANGNNQFQEMADVRLTQSPYSSRQITVNASYSEEEVSFSIQDEGPGFDPSSLPDPTDLAYLERPSGRGVLLMRSFTDEIKFNEQGNEVTLIKRKN